MTRDMDLIRQLMLNLEALPLEMGDAWSITPESESMAVPGYDLNQISYHMELIHKAGFINDGDGSGPMLGFVFCGLTWTGHDFLDATRDHTVWKKTKEIASRGGGFTVDLLIGIAKEVIKQNLGKLMGGALGL